MGNSSLSAARPAGRSTLTGPTPEFEFGTRADSPPRETVTCRQVHGANVVYVTGTPPRPSGEEGDALLTDRPGVVVGVRTADCLPLLLSGRAGKVVAAVHAGWRGTVREVAVEAVRTLAATFGVPSRGLTALLGPSIRACCYQVGEEVTGEVLNRFPSLAPQVLTRGPAGAPQLDLVALNRLQLLQAGVTDIRDLGSCTCCTPERYHSYRRDGADSGRMVNWIRAAD